MDEVTWEAWRSVAAIVSAMCAIVAATVSVAVWRKARASDLGSRIDDGDAKARAHVDRSVDELRRTTAEQVGEIRQTVDHMAEQLDGVRQQAARIEADTGHMLRPRDLGRIHEKINVVAQDSAATRALVEGQREQIGVIYKLLLECGQ